MKKKRTYNTRLIKRNRSYTVQDVATLFQISTNAVLRWGLTFMEGKKPQRIHGGELINHLNAKQSNRRHTCKANELYCCKCRRPQTVWENAAELIIRTPKQLNITGLCAICNTPAYRGGSVKKIHEYQKVFNVMTVREVHIVACVSPSVKCEL